MASSRPCGEPRIHVAPHPLSIEEASLFIASSLLLSHGVRPCTVAAVRLPGSWLAAASWSIRQFRPDEDSRVGWVRAVLRGKKLGAVVAPLQAGMEEVLAAAGVEAVGAAACISPQPPPTLEALEAAAASLLAAKPVVYSSNCRDAPTLGAPTPIAPAIVNIAADRLQAGLPPAPRAPGRGV